MNNPEPAVIGYTVLLFLIYLGGIIALWLL